MTGTIAELVAANPPDGIAFIAPDATLTWREYDELSSRLATAYVRAGWRPGQRLAVLLTGGALTHVAYLAAQKAGLVTVGIGPRAGDAEIAHLMRTTGASALVTRAAHRGRPARSIPAPRNEAGPISVTRVTDDRAHRLGTVGRPIPSARLRLLPPDGRIAVNGPGCTDGYDNDEAATAALIRPDGWLVTGDLGELDADGYLRVTGRATDFIIRGGHNISALAVEEAVGGHPRVAQVAVVPVPDDVLGERVCAYVVTVDSGPLSLDELRKHLDANGVSKHNWPERLVCRPELPLGTGGKVDKAALRGA